MDSKDILILSGKDVAECIDMPTAINAMENAFEQLSSKRAQLPLRTHIPIPEHDGTSLFMPVYLPDNGQVALKTVSVMKNNPELHGLPMIHALVQLFDAKTGQPIAIMDGEMLTAIRTGAASGLATRVLANESATTVAIIGGGVQGRSQLEAICTVRNIEHAFIFDLSPDAAAKFAVEMSDKLRIPVTLLKEMAQLDQADIICTATGSSKPLFDHDMLKTGTHINAIGAYRPDMCEIPPETVKAAQVFVDDKTACRMEAGDLIQAIDGGFIDETDIKTEIGEVLLGQKNGRNNKDAVTFFKSVGVAVQDLAAATIVYSQAKAKGLGTFVAI